MEPTTTDDAVGATRTFDALWGPSQVQRRGPKPKLSREQIVATAVAIGDAEGLAALSMQRISDELGCAKMALYRHVPGKAELAALMLDTVFGAPPAADPPSGDWRQLLRTWATSLFTIFSRHPWTLEVSVGVRVPGPHELAWLESGVGALAHSGLSGAERLDAVVLIVGHVRSLAQQGGRSPASDEGLEHNLAAVMSRILAERGDDYPQIRAAFGGRGDRDDALNFGLERILDGLSVLIDTRTQRR